MTSLESYSAIEPFPFKSLNTKRLINKIHPNKLLNKIINKRKSKHLTQKRTKHKTIYKIIHKNIKRPEVLIPQQTIKDNSINSSIQAIGAGTGALYVIPPNTVDMTGTDTMNTTP
jgi:hypothetical protein